MIKVPIELSEQTWPENTTPLVSVFNWVYNHKDFIRESIESMLMQKTTFPVEIIVHDDASNDGTKEIILEYQNKYPKLFRNILQDENQWSQGKSVMTPMFKKPKGNYIALTHGDDYWTDPYKLQKQVDLLEKNPKASMVFSNCQVDVNGVFIKTDLKYPSYFTFVDYLRLYNAIPTCTMVFRKECINLNNKTIELIKQCPVGDFPLRFLIGDKGDFIFLPESTSVYRRHERGISNNFHNSNHYLGILRMYKILNSYFNYKYDYFLGIHLQDTYERLFYVYCKEKLIFAAIKTFYKACIDFNGKFLKPKKCLNILKHGVKEFIRK
jgi:glycosyltransferase involved in cell wall biosynthesis